MSTETAGETLSTSDPERVVRIRVGRRGVLTVGPHGQLRGLDRICQRELRTNEQVRLMCGPHERGRPGRPTSSAGISRATLIQWRERKGFPPPFVVLNKKLELWSRTQVEDWLAENRSN